MEDDQRRQDQLNAAYQQWQLAQQYPIQMQQLMNSALGVAHKSGSLGQQLRLDTDLHRARKAASAIMQARGYHEAKALTLSEALQLAVDAAHLAITSP